MAFALSMVLLRARYYFLSLIILSGPFFSVYILATETLSKHDMTPVSMLSHPHDHTNVHLVLRYSKRLDGCERCLGLCCPGGNVSPREG